MGLMRALPPIQESILQRIGRTPLLALQALVPAGSARVLIKVESENPQVPEHDAVREREG